MLNNSKEKLFSEFYSIPNPTFQDFIKYKELYISEEEPLPSEEVVKDNQSLSYDIKSEMLNLGACEQIVDFSISCFNKEISKLEKGNDQEEEKVNKIKKAIKKIILYFCNHPEKWKEQLRKSTKI